MRVGLNISTTAGSVGGVGNYAFQLARELPGAAPEDEWVFFGARANHVPLLTRRNAQAAVAQRTGVARLLWEQTGLPREARRERVDLLHGADFSRPLAYKGPVVNTIHDVAPFEDSQYFPFARRAYKKTLIAYAARRSDAVITVSEFSRSQIIERFAVDENRVFAIHHGVDPMDGVTRLKADPPFLLFVGRLENRKNLARLVKAFGLLRERRRIPHHLVLAGNPGHGYEEIRTAIETGGLRDCVETPGYVSDEDLARLYSSAEVFVFPSVYEGFGLPPLEAMARGTPVACSRAASLPEVGGDAAAYFDPYSEEEMASVLERVLESPELRAEMREKGLKQAAKFTWEECARKHVEVYRSVLAS